MVSKADQQRVCALLTEAVTVICKNGLTYNSKFSIEGLLGITLDDRDIFLVNIKETIQSINGNANQRKSESDSRVGGQQRYTPHNGRGRGMPQMAYGSPMSMGSRGGRGMPQHLGSMPDRRRKFSGQGAAAVPAKRMMTSPGGAGQFVRTTAGGAEPSDKMPQEWAALIQLQQTQQRGRGAPSARRRGFMRHPGPGRGGPVSPTWMASGRGGGQGRRSSQGSIQSPTETAEAREEKHAELARQRAERLERRKALSSGESVDVKVKTEPHSSNKTETTDTSDHGDKSPSAQDHDKEAKEISTTEEHQEDQEHTVPKTDQNDDPTAVKGDETEENTEPRTAKELEEGQSSSSHRRKEQVPPGREEGGSSANPDGSWLLSNSSWLLGDLEAMSEDSSWRMHPHRQAEGGGGKYAEGGGGKYAEGGGGKYAEGGGGKYAEGGGGKYAEGGGAKYAEGGGGKYAEGGGGKYAEGGGGKYDEGGQDHAAPS